MDLDIHIGSTTEITRRLFRLKPPSQNGLLLNIHHSIGNKKIRFNYACFHENGHFLGSADSKGNCYIFDLKQCKFWAVSKVDSCTCMSFSLLNPNELLIALKGGDIIIVHIGSGLAVGKLCGHKNNVKYISFAKEYCLSSSQYEAIIWNLQIRSKIQVLNLDTTNPLKYVGFLPVSGNILACFQDDLIQVWNSQTFETIKQFLPSNWKNHTVKSITFTKNGEIMVVSGYLSTLAVFQIQNWKFLKLISPDGIHTIRHTEFLSQPFDGGCNKILVILSGQGVIHFYNIEQNVILGQISTTCEIIKAECSPNGNYLACVLCSGEVEIYDLEQYVAPSINVKVEKVGKHTRVSKRHIESLEIVKEEIDEILTIGKLKSLLKEYGEFPQIHRLKIWEKLLQLPNNIKQYNSIINHVTVIAFKDLQSKYPLESKLSIKDLKKVLNNLVTWCPFFANVDYLPLFAYPFVKVFQNKPIACFEAICTIILNWCQHWFEYYPLPPVNILAMAENTLMEHDPALLHHFASNNITSDIFVWTLLETAFSEVLTSSEWLIFWDHVITNEIPFLLCATTAYSIVQRNILITLTKFEEVQYFFHNQNPVDMKKFLKMTYCILNNTSERIHPRQYLRNFRSIEKGDYPLFIEYPKNIIEFETRRMKKINEEMNELENEKRDLIEQKNSKSLKVFNDKLQKEEDRRMKVLQKLCEEKLNQKEMQLRKEQRELEELKQASNENSLENQNIEKRNSFLRRNRANEHSQKHNETLALKEKYLTQLKDILKYKYIIERVLKDPRSVPSDYENAAMKKKYEKIVEREIQKIDKSVESLLKLKKLNIKTCLEIIDNFIKNIEKEIEIKNSGSYSNNPDIKTDADKVNGKGRFSTVHEILDDKKTIINSRDYSKHINRKSCCCDNVCPKTVRFCESSDN